MTKHIPFDTMLNKHLGNDAELRHCYLQVAWEDFQVDGDSELFWLCLYDVIKAQKKEEDIATLLELSPATLRQNLREQTPSLLQMQKILHVLGYRLRLETEESKQNSEALEAMAV